MSGMCKRQVDRFMQCVRWSPKRGTETYMQLAHLFDGFDLPILAFLTGFAGRGRLFDQLLNALSRLDLFKGVALMCLFWYVWAEAPADEPSHIREQRQKRLVRVL